MFGPMIAKDNLREAESYSFLPATFVLEVRTSDFGQAGMDAISHDLTVLNPTYDNRIA
jgi:hypothetical protein